MQDAWTYGCVDMLIYGSMDGSMDRWIDGSMDVIDYATNIVLL